MYESDIPDNMLIPRLNSSKHGQVVESTDHFSAFTFIFRVVLKAKGATVYVRNAASQIYLSRISAVYDSARACRGNSMLCRVGEGWFFRTQGFCATRQGREIRTDPNKFVDREVRQKARFTEEPGRRGAD
jgi:hypothetical protein